MDENKIIGLKIKELRSRKSVELGEKLTQKGLADILGISRSYLGDIESGRTKPNEELLMKIAKILDVNISELTTCKTEIDVIKETNSEYLPELNNKDEKDIAKKLSETLSSLEKFQEGLMFDGEPIDEETRELLKISLENSIKLAKQIAKQKYTPNKYKQ